MLILLLKNGRVGKINREVTFAVVSYVIDVPAFHAWGVTLWSNRWGKLMAVLPWPGTPRVMDIMAMHMVDSTAYRCWPCVYVFPC